MTMFEINDLLMQINALRDNARDWSPADVETCAATLQRMAADLPSLSRDNEALRRCLDAVSTIIENYEDESIDAWQAVNAAREEIERHKGRG